MTNNNIKPNIDEFTTNIAKYIYNHQTPKEGWQKDLSTCNCGNCYEYGYVSVEEIAEKIKEAMIAIYGIEQ